MVAWRNDLRFAYSSVCQESASAGFVRYAEAVVCIIFLLDHMTCYIYHKRQYTKSHIVGMTIGKVMYNGTSDTLGPAILMLYHFSCVSVNCIAMIS